MGVGSEDRALGKGHLVDVRQWKIISDSGRGGSTEPS